MPLTSGQIQKIIGRRDYKILQNKRLVNAVVIGLVILAFLILVIWIGYLLRSQEIQDKPLPPTNEAGLIAGETNVSDQILTADTPMITIYEKKPNIWYSMIDPNIETKDGSDEIKSILQLVCGRHLVNLPTDQDQELCWKTLYAMTWQESYFNTKKTGDQGRSIGWFHIQVVLHKTTRDCAMNLGCSADWTLSNMIANGYPNRYLNAIQNHNGWGTVAAKNLEYAKIIQGKLALIQ